MLLLIGLIIQIVFIILKSCHLINWSWVGVLSPIEIYLLWNICILSWWRK
jgi:hypothetical protein